MEESRGQARRAREAEGVFEPRPAERLKMHYANRRGEYAADADVRRLWIPSRCIGQRPQTRAVPSSSESRASAQNHDPTQRDLPKKTGHFAGTSTRGGGAACESVASPYLGRVCRASLNLALLDCSAWRGSGQRPRSSGTDTSHGVAGCDAGVAGCTREDDAAQRPTEPPSRARERSGLRGSIQVGDVIVGEWWWRAGARRRDGNAVVRSAP